MSLHLRVWGLPAAVTLAVCFGLTGCGKGGVRSAEEEDLAKVAVAYNRYIATHNGRPPANEAEFKKFLTSLKPDDRSQMDIEDPDKVLVSPRDKEPLVVRYGQTMSRGAPAPGGEGSGPKAPIVAYERTGVNDKRMVVYLTGQTEEVDLAQLKQMVPNAQ